MCGRYQRSFVG